jgi:hypothetical protein
MKIITATFPSLSRALPFLRLVTSLCLSYSVIAGHTRRVITVDALLHEKTLLTHAKKFGATRVLITERK